MPPNVIHYPFPPPQSLPPGASVALDDGAATPAVKDGALTIEHDDGSASIDLNPRSDSRPVDPDFYANLALEIDDSELGRIANDLLDGIAADDQSREEWKQTRAQAITLLGFKVEEPSGDVGNSSAPLEGMSRTRHPLLAEATLRFQANAYGEMLPASGPVKVRDDSTVKPAPLQPGLGHNGGPPMQAAPAPVPPAPGMAPSAPPPPPISVPSPTAERDETADALEADFNHYLTTTASEYYPDTDRMLFYVGLSGQGFKKVYNCPLRQRPVSESVNAEDLIVSNNATDLKNAGRITHRIKMRPSTLKRMQIVGAYRDVPLAQPTYVEANQVDQKKAEIQGVTVQPTRPQDADYEVYECYCELNISGYEHKDKGKETGLHVPYVVTIEKQSRVVLAVRRNWVDGDFLCMPKTFFVDFPFVRALGFYGVGLVHILGNLAVALTAAWREALDLGMFKNFPGGLIAKQAGRQNTNNFRVGPGSFAPVETGGMKISDAVMAMPYSDLSAGFAAFVDHVEQVAQRVGGTAETNVGEGRQDAPVGTTIALIEQATKVLNTVHKRLFNSQGEEFRLLKERFREDPEAFWRHNKKPTLPWKKEQFLKALEDNDLVPVADPNNPTHFQRIMIAQALRAMAQQHPEAYDLMAVEKFCLRVIGVDPEGILKDDTAQAQPQQQPPDPKVMELMLKAKQGDQQAQMNLMDMRLKNQIEMAKLNDSAADRASKERLAALQQQNDVLRLATEMAIHPDAQPLVGNTLAAAGSALGG